MKINGEGSQSVHCKVQILLPANPERASALLYHFPAFYSSESMGFFTLLVFLGSTPCQFQVFTGHCSGPQHVLPYINMQCSDVNQVRYVHCDFMPSVSSKATWVRHTVFSETSLVAQVELERANNRNSPLFSLSLLQKLLCNWSLSKTVLISSC